MRLERESSIVTVEEEKPQEHCGLVGIFTTRPSKEIIPVALQAASGVQHRGQNGAGIALPHTDGTLLSHTGEGLLQYGFNDEVLEKFNHRQVPWAIVHTRYGTSGKYHTDNLQPIIANAPDGEQVAVAHNGQLVNMAMLRRKVAEKLGFLPSQGASDTWLFTQILAYQEGRSWEEKLLKTLDEVGGAYSFIIGTKDKVFVARDPHMIRPLVLGKFKDGFIVASETHALDKVGVMSIREVQRGEVLSISKNGLQVVREGLSGKGHFCSLELAYFSRPDSKFQDDQEGWRTFWDFRFECGKVLVKEYPYDDIDIVIGVPDSGIPLASGFAHEAGRELLPIIIRDHYDPNGDKRTFLHDKNKKGIPAMVVGKLSFVPQEDVWKDKVIAVLDDSIIRANVSKSVVDALWKLGARKIHFFSGFPPIKHICHLGMSWRTYGELVAARHDGDIGAITAEIGATTVNYISPEGFIRALRPDLTKPEDPREIFLANGLCGGCMTGVHPVSKRGKVWQPSTTFTSTRDKVYEKDTNLPLDT